MRRLVPARRGPSAGEYPGTRAEDAVAGPAARRPSPPRQRQPPPPPLQQEELQLRLQRQQRHQEQQDDHYRQRAEPQRSSAFAAAATAVGAQGPEFPAIERARALFEQRQRERSKQLGEELASTMQRAVAAAAEAVAGSGARPGSRSSPAPHQHPRGAPRERRPLHEPARAAQAHAHAHAQRAINNDGAAAERLQANRREIERVLSAAVGRRVLDVFAAGAPPEPAPSARPEEDPFVPFHVERGLAAQVRRKVDALLAADRTARAPAHAARAARA
jgi:hypothetical protein